MLALVQRRSVQSSKFKYALLIGYFLSLPVSAMAQQNENSEPKGDWQITIGPEVIVAPEYFGSKKYEITPFPVVDIVWKERFFISTLRGLGLYAINDKDSGIEVGLSVIPGQGRIASRLEPRLRGLGRISTPIAANIFASYAPTEFSSIFAGVTKDFGGTNGYQANIGAGVGAPIGERISISASVSATYFDRKLKQGFLGVTAAQSAATGFRVFTPKAGLHSVSFRLDPSYKLTDHMSIFGFLNADRLLGSSARSPIVQRKWDRSAGLGLTYTF